MPSQESTLPKPAPPRIASTTRIEAFSDGVFAVVITLLILEVHVPTLSDHSMQAVVAALVGLAPKLISFGVSFFTVAVIWVNHHHFFEPITHSDWKLLWYNSFFLFWVTVVPFTTAFIGSYPTQQLVVALYSFTLAMVAFSSVWMGRYVFFKSDLFSPLVSMDDRRRSWTRYRLSVLLYAGAGALAFVAVYASLAILALVPFIYVVPSLLRRED
jgi:uncharacterized membrane protein